MSSFYYCVEGVPLGRLVVCVVRTDDLTIDSHRQFQSPQDALRDVARKIRTVAIAKARERLTPNE